MWPCMPAVLALGREKQRIEGIPGSGSSLQPGICKILSEKEDERERLLGQWVGADSLNSQNWIALLKKLSAVSLECSDCGYM